MTTKYKSIEDESCPVCGYYCLGKGGQGCIDKPSLFEAEKKFRSYLKDNFGKQNFAEVIKDRA